MGNYVSKWLYHSLQKRNAELKADVERLELARRQLLEELEVYRSCPNMIGPRGKKKPCGCESICPNCNLM